MTGPEVIDISREAIQVVLVAAGPTMLVGLVVGLVVALFQALTQVQEMTLVFVPKIAAIFVALILFAPMIGAALALFASQIFDRIAAM
jgi:flagellar biosynthetic protein FliQ